MTFATVLLFALITFVAAPLAIYCGSAMLMHPRSGQRLPLLLVTAPLAPLALALALMVLYSLPLRPAPLSTIAIIVVAVAAILYLGRDNLTKLHHDIVAMRAPRWPGWSSVNVMLGLLVGLVVLQIATLPMMENDALEYMAVARRIFEMRSLAAYPVVEAAPNGLFAPSSHPPAYHLYLVWGYAWLGPTNYAPARLLSLYTLVGMASLLWVALRRHGELTVAMGLLLLLMVPLYVTMLVGYHIDPLRLMAFLAAAIAMSQVIECPRPRQAVLTGAILGLAAFAHSIGILAWLFGAITWLLLGPADRFRDFRVALIIVLVAMAIGGLQFAKNMITFGVPIQDSAPVWEMPELAFAQDLRYRRDLLVPFDRVVFGIFRGLFELPLFGLLFWLVLPVLWQLWREPARANTLERVAALWIAFYFGLAAVTATLGSDLVIKNPRYLLTLAPLAVVLAAPMLAGWQPERPWPRRVLALLLCTLSGWVLLQSVARTANYGARLDIARVGERAPIYRANNRFPGAPLYRHIEQNLQPGERTLVFRQADFTTYGKGDWIDNFDTALIQFYRLNTPEEAHAWLRARNVRFAMVPDYTFPTYYRSMAGRLLSDPSFAESVGAHRGFRLLRLRDERAAVDCRRLSGADITIVPWRRAHSWRSLVGTVAGLPFLANAEVIQFGIPVHGDWARLGARDYSLAARTPYGDSVRLMTGLGPVEYAPIEPWLKVSGPGENVAVRLDAVGRGLMGVEVVEYLSNGQVIVSRLWDGIITETPTTVALQYSPQPSIHAFRLQVQNLGRASATVELRNIEICRRSAPVRQAASDMRPATRLAHWTGEQVVVDCEVDASRVCVSSNKRIFVRQRLSDGVALWGELGRLSTPGFKPGISFRYRGVLEEIRITLARYPDATFTAVLQPVLDWIARPASSSVLVPHGLEVEASGQGAYTAYVQYSTPEGRIDWRVAGAFFLDAAPRRIQLDFDLPSDARDLELILLGTATQLTIGRMQVNRWEAARTQSRT